MVFVRGETELETWLLSQGYPVSFGGWDFKHWLCDDLRRAIRSLDRYARPVPRKMELCKQLCDIKPDNLTRDEQQLIDRIRAEREADRVLQDRDYGLPRGKKRARPSRDESEEVEVTARPSTPELRSAVRKFQLPTPSTSLSNWNSSLVYAPWGTPQLPDWRTWYEPPTPPTPTPTTRECQICINNKPINLFPTIPEDAICQHREAITCISCLATHIETRSQTSQLNAIPCPEPNCIATLSYTQMQRYAFFNTFRRYDNFLNQLALKELPDYYPCTNPTCDSGSFGDDRTSSYMICSDCGTRSCITCNTAWHPDLSHEENQEHMRKEAEEERANNAVCKAQEERTEQTLKQKTKVCPGEGCGVRLWKAGGCDHMTCGRCQYEFCWLCMADYDTIRQHGNHMHVKGCWYHRPLPEPKAQSRGNGRKGKGSAARLRK